MDRSFLGGQALVHRDPDAIRRNLIRRSFSEVLKTFGLSEMQSRELLEDAIIGKLETVSCSLAQPTERAKIECGGGCGRQISSKSRTGLCKVCRSKCGAKKCLDCGARILRRSTRCPACAIKKIRLEKRNKKAKLQSENEDHA